MNNQEIEITILCGGPCIRMGKLASKRQKCMLEVEGRPILEHLFEQNKLSPQQATGYLPLRTTFAAWNRLIGNYCLGCVYNS